MTATVYAIREGTWLWFDYTNHRGKTERRNVRYIGMEFGTVPDYYPEPTLMLRGWCADRKAARNFDVSKIKNLEI